MRGWIATLALGIVSSAAAADGVWLEIEQNGVFGAGPPRRVEVAASGQRLRLRDADAQRTYYVDRAAREVLEVDTARREAARKPFAAYGELRADRARKRAAQLERIRTRREAADDDERAEIDARLRELGLRLDGRELITRGEGAPFPRPLTLGAVPQVVLCTPTTLRVNQAREPVAALQLAKGLELPVQPLDVYVELGMLPEPLERALSELEGTVLAGELLLDDGSLKKRVTFRVLEVRRGVDVGDLEPPAGLKRVERLGEAERPNAETRTCLHCEGPLGEERITLNGRPFCSRAHRHAWIKAQAKK